LRFLHILPSIAPETGGTAASVLQLCRREARRGKDVVLYTTDWTKENSSASSRVFSDLSEKSLTVNIFPAKTNGLFPGVPHSPALLRSLTTGWTNFDAVLCHSLWNPLATFSMKLLRKKGVRYALMPHGMLDPIVLRHNRWKKLAWSAFWERSNVEGASLIVFNTEAEEQKARLCGWHIHNTFVLPHLVELSSWKNLPPRSVFEDLFPQVRGAEVILFVGRINWVKNLDKLIDALATVRQIRPSAMLVCVGPDNDGYRHELEHRANTLGLNGGVLFTGMLVGDRLKAAYARANMAALVSQKENFGLTVAEALASGLPVVVSTGVDLSAGWESQGPVRRVTPTSQAIASAIIALLERVNGRGLPDLEAQALAEKEWGQSRMRTIGDAFCSVVPRNNHD
jgi:glycosyltransferase involved in cell wall biosynthesis